MSQEPEQKTPPMSRKYRRGSAGGMALHRWQKSGKLTTIHIVYEMETRIAVEQLVAAIDEKLLKRFPRFRGYVLPNETHWEVPDTVNPADYVEVLEMNAPTPQEEQAVLKAHVARQMTLPLPPKRSWNVQLITFPKSEGCFVVWRISHTVADGVILAQIMSKVLCDTIPDDAVKEAPLAMAPSSAPAASDDAPPAAATTSAAAGSSPSSSRSKTRAGLCERIWCFLCGVFFVVALPFWPSDRHTPLQLGPNRWKRRIAAQGDNVDAVTGVPEGKVHGAGVDGIAICVGEPVDVGAIKSAANAAGVTVNDLLMTALAAGMREYLEGKGQLPSSADKLKLTAVAVINPRSAMPQEMGGGASQTLLSDYAEMRGEGCDITLAILPLPCGKLDAEARRTAVAALTRKIKLSPSPLLLRFFAKVLCKCFGLSSLIFLYTIVLAKFTTYVSNVVAPPLTGAFCGARISDIWFGTTPLDFGVSFSFLSYAGRNRLCCVADKLTVPDPELMAAKVHAKLLEQIESISGVAGVVEPAATVPVMLELGK